MAVPVALWLGSRRGGSSTARVLAYPAMGALHARDPAHPVARRARRRPPIGARRLVRARAAAAAEPAGARCCRSRCAVAVGAWALSKDAFTKSAAAARRRRRPWPATSALLVLLMLRAAAARGPAVEAWLGARRVPSALRRRASGIAAVAARLPACRWPRSPRSRSATAARERSATASTSSRARPQVVARGGRRPRVRGVLVAREVLARGRPGSSTTRPLAGVGRRRVRRRPPALPQRHLGHPPRARLRPADDGRPRRAWARRSRRCCCSPGSLAALRATGLLPAPPRARGDADEPPPRRDWDAERIALVALVLVPRRVRPPVADRLDLVHPGARGDGARRGGLRGRARPVAAPSRRAGATRRQRGGPTRRAASRAARWRRVATALLHRRWAIWQPEASDRATNQALDAGRRAHFDDALAKTKDAEDANPLTPEPLLVRAVGRHARPTGCEDARATLEQAVICVPGRSADLVPSGGLRARHARPPAARRSRRSAARSTSIRTRGRPPSCSSNARARLREKTGAGEARRSSDVARASSDPARRSSERDLEASSSSTRASERRVKKRRCGESGSGRRA